MKLLTTKALIILLLSLIVIGCTPEVGSEQWCQDMKEKPKGDWTMMESKDFAKHCIF